MRWAEASATAIVMLSLAAACRSAPTENPYAELPPPEPAPDLDAQARALEARAAEAATRAEALADEAQRLSDLPACGCDGVQACRVRCEAPAEPRCVCEPLPSCACVAGE